MKHPLIRFAGWLFLFHLAASLLGVACCFSPSICLEMPRS